MSINNNLNDEAVKLNTAEETVSNKEERVIILYDCDQISVVKTNTPADIIEQAIDYKNYLLDNDLNMSSDFEEMQDYIWKQNPGYTFEWVGDIGATLYTTDIESYEW